MSTDTTITAIPVHRIDGSPTSLAEHQGKVMLLVNVASKCGLTPQYEGLEKIYRAYREQGFVVCGFPANDFAGQEPGSNDEIQTFCTSSFGVDFPMYEKITVTGPDRHPLYTALTTAQPKPIGDTTGFRQNLQGYGITPLEEPEVLWNFEKFLVSRDAEVVARFAPDLVPDDPAICAAIEQELLRA